MSSERFDRAGSSEFGAVRRKIFVVAPARCINHTPMRGSLQL